MADMGSRTGVSCDGVGWGHSWANMQSGGRARLMDVGVSGLAGGRSCTPTQAWTHPPLPPLVCSGDSTTVPRRTEQVRWQALPHRRESQHLDALGRFGREGRTESRPLGGQQGSPGGLREDPLSPSRRLRAPLTARATGEGCGSESGCRGRWSGSDRSSGQIPGVDRSRPVGSLTHKGQAGKESGLQGFAAAAQGGAACPRWGRGTGPWSFP